jgi:hypothetical protein
VKSLRWLLAAALGALLAAFATAAVNRPYADNQRNWLIIAAVLSGLALAAGLLLRSVMSGAREFVRAVISEWKTRG